MPRERSYGAVVVRNADGRLYLLLQYEAGHWDLVKGHAKRGESGEEAAVRELREETGIADARFVPGFREEINYFFRARGRTVYKEVVYFLMETDQADVVLSFEHIGYKWLPYDKALAQATFQNTRDVLMKAHAFLEKKP
ncbi:MAG: NUDIX domain-containing protein [Methanomicrobiales archaeon]|nr:NUDIX domain-containing protein [Methanomicrobiales archaeon]MDI6876767.1 NUDIX domain-containing protein [Methanomicrobiales archaeon]